MMVENLLQHTAEERKEILSVFNRNPDSIKIDVAMVKRWIKSQPHLPEVPSDFMMEKFLVMNKMSIEKTKVTIDYYYSLKNVFPDMFGSRLLNEKAFDKIYYVPMPKLFKNCRLVYFKVRDPNPNNFHPMDIFKLISNFSEIRAVEDYALAEICLLDLSGLTFTHASKLSPQLLKTLSFISENVFRNNMRALHVMNPPPYFESVVSFLRGYFPAKLVDRIRIHKDFDSVLEHVPREYLPSDFGGQQKSIDEIQKLWHMKLRNFAPRFKYLNEMIVNDALRPEKLKNHESLGFHGNFRKLDVD